MKDNVEKRRNERQSASAPIVLSYFNKEECFKAQTLNHCPGGVCFKSEVYLKPGAAILFRVNSFDLNDPCCNNCGGLRSISLAEVKWCSDVLNPKIPSYKIGVKYYEPAY